MLVSTWAFLIYSPSAWDGESSGSEDKGRVWAKMQENLVLEDVCVSSCAEHIKNEIGVWCKKKNTQKL